MREFSIQLFGDFLQEETILEELNLIQNPGHVYIKETCKISINGQTIDFSQFNADIAISSILLNNINSIKAMRNKVITVENTKTFNRF
ncbi:MAG: hypothetical protein K2K06_03230 [Oscillospiraceae bacterium]|nr:hypothetical protein [Oscillospiraceae bacterium]